MAAKTEESMSWATLLDRNDINATRRSNSQLSPAVQRALSLSLEDAVPNFNTSRSYIAALYSRRTDEDENNGGDGGGDIESNAKRQPQQDSIESESGIVAEKSNDGSNISKTPSEGKSSMTSLGLSFFNTRPPLEEVIFGASTNSSCCGSVQEGGAKAGQGHAVVGGPANTKKFHHIGRQLQISICCGIVAAAVILIVTVVMVKRNMDE